MSRQNIGQYISQYAFVVYIFKIQPTVAVICYIIFLNGFHKYDFVIFHQTSTVMLLYF